jgi:hypothetical protein
MTEIQNYVKSWIRSRKIKIMLLQEGLLCELIITIIIICAVLQGTIAADLYPTHTTVSFAPQKNAHNGSHGRLQNVCTVATVMSHKPKL